MSKKVKQTLTGAMAAMMATGVVATPAMAVTTDIDALYKAAYNATQKALTEKTQAAVNEARAAIKALPTNLDWAIGEFSKQVDTVQHPILVNIVNAIKVAEENPTQANINAAKKAIPADLTPVFKNSYSSAVDKIQQGLQVKVVEAVKLAETSKKAEDVEAAKTLIADIATADSQAIKDWANIMLTKVEAIKLYDLDITKIVSVSLTGVSVEFTALEEALRDVTIEVKDDKGNIVAVDKNPLLVEEEKEATFTFTKALTTRGTGIWTVNGIEINLDHVNLIADLGNLSSASGEDVYQILSKSGLIKNVIDKVANHEKYLEIFKAEEFETVEDVQKLVDKANSELVSADEIKTIVEIAKDNQKYTIRDFTSALGSVTLEKVNSNWMNEYRDEVDDITVYTVEKLQAAIDKVNKNKIDAAVTKATVSDETKLVEKDINDAIEIVKLYMVDDKDKVTDKADKLAGLNKLLAIYKIDIADTQASLKAALKAYYSLLDESKDYSKEVNEVNMGAYLAENKKTVINTDVKVGTLITNGEAAAKTDAETAVKAAAKAITDVAEDKVTASMKTALINSLNKLASVTALNQTPFSTKGLVEANVIAYAKAITATTPTLDHEFITKVNDTVSGETVKDAIGSVTSDDDLLKALKGLGVKNLVDSNKKAYNELIDQDQDGDQKMSVLQDKVDAVNSFALINTSKDVAVVSAELINLALNETVTDLAKYIDVAGTELVRQDVAELVIADIATNKAPYTNIAALATKVLGDQSSTFGLVGDAKDMVDAVNKADTNSAMRTALEAISSEFKALSATEKLAKIEVVFAFLNKTDDKGQSLNNTFKNFTEVRNILK